MSGTPTWVIASGSAVHCSKSPNPANVQQPRRRLEQWDLPEQIKQNGRTGW